MASYLADDCVYEDLLLNYPFRSKAAFADALRWHPAFVLDPLGRPDREAQLADAALPPALRKLGDPRPQVNFVVDKVAASPSGDVGVEWHVEWGDSSDAFPLGRGLSFCEVDVATGKITRVVDIAEAPWRLVGLILTPAIRFGEWAIRGLLGKGWGEAR